MTITVVIKPVSVGVERTVVQEGIPAVIPLDPCYMGWQQSLVLLGKLVEAQVE